jgi:hypothetical protein
MTPEQPLAGLARRAGGRTSEELHDSNTGEHHAARYEDEGRGPDSQTDADRQYPTDEPPPSVPRSETIDGPSAGIGWLALATFPNTRGTTASCSWTTSPHKRSLAAMGGGRPNGLFFAGARSCRRESVASRSERYGREAGERKTNTAEGQLPCRQSHEARVAEAGGNSPRSGALSRHICETGSLHSAHGCEESAPGAWREQQAVGLQFCVLQFHLQAQTPSAFCSYFACEGEFSTEPGYIVECADGTFGHAGGISGSCSSHGGNRRPLLRP